MGKMSKKIENSSRTPDFAVNIIKTISRIKNASRSYTMMLETSSFCNAKCVFCSNPHLIRKKNIMSDEVFELILERIKREKINVKNFKLILNGEPLTDPFIFKRVSRIKELFPDAFVGFTTNFALADDDKIENIMKCGLNRIIISLNSLDPVEYKKMMSLELDQVIDNILLLLKKKEELKSNLIVKLSVVIKNKDDYETLSRLDKMFGGALELRPIKLGKWIGHDNDHEHSHLSSSAQRMGLCGDLHRHIFILANGDYALCCFDPEGVLKLNVNDIEIKRAINSKMIMKMRLHQLICGRTNRICEGCSSANDI